MYRETHRVRLKWEFELRDSQRWLVSNDFKEGYNFTINLQEEANRIGLYLRFPSGKEVLLRDTIYTESGLALLKRFANDNIGPKLIEGLLKSLIDIESKRGAHG